MALITTILTGTPDSIPTPPSGDIQYFYNTNDSNNLWSKNDAGVSSPLSEEECCACDIAKMLVEGVMCAFKKGLLTAAELGAFFNPGPLISSTKVTDPDTGAVTCTVSIATNPVA